MMLGLEGRSDIQLANLCLSLRGRGGTGETTGAAWDCCVCVCVCLQEVDRAYVRKGDLEANAHSLVEELGFLRTLYEEVRTGCGGLGGSHLPLTSVQHQSWHEGSKVTWWLGGLVFAYMCVAAGGQGGRQLYSAWIWLLNETEMLVGSTGDENPPCPHLGHLNHRQDEQQSGTEHELACG